MNEIELKARLCVRRNLSGRMTVAVRVDLNVLTRGAWTRGDATIRPFQIHLKHSFPNGANSQDLPVANHFYFVTDCCYSC